MTETILLTGATGFLGSHLLKALIKENYKVVILKRSFSNTYRIDNLIDKVNIYDIDTIPFEKAFEDQKIDTVIHTATNYGRSNERASNLVDVNLMFGLKLLETAIDFNIDIFINTDTLQYKYLSNYTLSKKQFVEWFKIISEDKKIKITNLRLEHMYGPGDDNKKFVVWLMEQMLSNKEEIKLTAGEQKRDFIYIDDIVNAYLLIMQQTERLPQFSEFDVGTGEQISIKEFVLKLKDTIESKGNKPISTKLKFGAIPYRKGEMMEVVENINPLLSIGWKPNTCLSDGLKMVVNEFMGRETYI